MFVKSGNNTKKDPVIHLIGAYYMLFLMLMKKVSSGDF